MVLRNSNRIKNAGLYMTICMGRKGQSFRIVQPNGGSPAESKDFEKYLEAQEEALQLEEKNIALRRKNLELEKALRNKQ